MDLGSLRKEGSEAGAATLATVTSDLPTSVDQQERCAGIRPLFLRTSGSSGVLKALLLERNGQLSCNPKTKKKKKKKKKLLLGGELFHKHYIGQYQAALAEYGNIVT